LNTLLTYSTWISMIEQLEEVIKGLRDQRWDEDLDDFEEDTGLDVRNKMLSKEDPETLQAELNKAVGDVFNGLLSVLNDQVRDLSDQERGGKAMFLLRVIREIRQKLPEQGVADTWALEVVPRLHGAVAEVVAESALQAFTVAISR